MATENFTMDEAVEDMAIDFANSIADGWLKHYPDEPMNGDETEALSDIFLSTLNERMGNT